MADDDIPKPKRFQSHAERDASGLAAKRERESRVPQPIYPPDEITGKYTGEELRERRATRSTESRVGHAEERIDQTVFALGEINGAMGNLRADVATKIAAVSTEMGNLRSDVSRDVGSLKGSLTGLQTVVENAMATVQKREHLHLKVEADVATADAIDQIKARDDARNDELDARKARRKRATLLISAVVGLVASGGIITVLLQKLGIIGP